MANTTKIYFLTEADVMDEAVQRVSAYLDSENFYNNFNILHESSGELLNKRNEVNEFMDNWNWKKAANDVLVLARKHRVTSNFYKYGCSLIKAGNLYAQHLSLDSYVFNIDEGDYSIPFDNKDWWVIAVEFHY